MKKINYLVCSCLVVNLLIGDIFASEIKPSGLSPSLSPSVQQDAHKTEPIPVHYAHSFLEDSDSDTDTTNPRPTSSSSSSSSSGKVVLPMSVYDKLSAELKEPILRLDKALFQDEKKRMRIVARMSDFTMSDNLDLRARSIYFLLTYKSFFNESLENIAIVRHILDLEKDPEKQKSLLESFKEDFGGLDTIYERIFDVLKPNGENSYVRNTPFSCYCALVHLLAQQEWRPWNINLLMTLENEIFSYLQMDEGDRYLMTVSPEIRNSILETLLNLSAVVPSNSENKYKIDQMIRTLICEDIPSTASYTDSVFFGDHRGGRYSVTLDREFDLNLLVKALIVMTPNVPIVLEEEGESIRVGAMRTILDSEEIKMDKKLMLALNTVDIVSDGWSYFFGSHILKHLGFLSERGLCTERFHKNLSDEYKVRLFSAVFTKMSKMSNKQSNMQKRKLLSPLLSHSGYWTAELDQQYMAQDESIPATDMPIDAIVHHYFEGGQYSIICDMLQCWLYNENQLGNRNIVRRTAEDLRELKLPERVLREFEISLARVQEATES